MSYTDSPSVNLQGSKGRLRTRLCWSASKRRSASSRFPTSLLISPFDPERERVVRLGWFVLEARAVLRAGCSVASSCIRDRLVARVALDSVASGSFREVLERPRVFLGTGSLEIGGVADLGLLREREVDLERMIFSGSFLAAGFRPRLLAGT